MKRHPVLIGALATSALLVGGGIAIADIPSSTDGTITACMVKPGGTIRLINAEGGATCKKGEVKVEWNAEGQPGQDGVSGYATVERETVVQFDGPQRAVVVQGACPTGKAVMATSVSGAYQNADNSFAGGVTQGYSLLRDTDSDGIRDAIDFEFFRDNGELFEAGRNFSSTIRLNCIDVTS